nr:hypothetical protein GCM10017745_33830 [Saccharothrix mutabilis subsp. capreolus]
MALPFGADAEAVNVSVADAEPPAVGVTEDGEIVPVTPEGRPDTLSEVCSEKVPVLVTFTATDAVPPGLRLTDAGVASTVKPLAFLHAPDTVSVNVRPDTGTKSLV